MSGNKILIVEDSKTQAIKLQYLLEDNNYEVAVAYDGSEALQKVTENRFDLIISDVVMPNMDGFELCEKLKQNDQYRDIPFILLTTLDKIEHVLKGLSLGGDNFVSKPYDEKFLLDRIDNVLNHREVNFSDDQRYLNVKIRNEDFLIEAKPEKILNYFISSYYATVNTNDVLQSTNSKLADLTNTLEQRVQHRTAQLEEEIAKHKKTSEELKIALEKTQKLDLLKTEFMNNLSHEIRTPMNSIMGFTELFLNRDISEEELIGFLPYISKSLDLLLRIITELIEAAETMTGYISVKNSKCNLRELLNGIEKQYSSNLDTAGKTNTLRLTTTIPGAFHNITVVTSISIIKTVFDKLISNAIKFSEQGIIECGIRSMNDDVIEFYVKDEGIGIENKHSEEIFECFKQLEPRDHNKYQGTGVGLAIAKKVTEHVGGNIWLESEPGEGTTFYFTIPYYKDIRTKTEPKVSQKAVKKDNLSNVSILIAEDVETNYLVVQAIADMKHFNLYWARNGREAVDMYNELKEHIDMVLMDIQMPVMDGVEATRIIKKDNPEALIIALTAYATDFESDGLRKKGFNALIKKPVRPSTLMEIIENQLIAK